MLFSFFTDVIIWASTVPSSSNIHDGIMPFIDLHWCSFLPASLHSLALQPLSLFHFPGIIIQQKANGLIGHYSCHSLVGDNVVIIPKSLQCMSFPFLFGIPFSLTWGIIRSSWPHSWWLSCVVASVVSAQFLLISCQSHHPKSSQLTCDLTHLIVALLLLTLPMVYYLHI